MSMPTNADINARLEELESAVARLSKAWADLERQDPSADASAASAEGASSTSASSPIAPVIKQPPKTQTGPRSKFRNALSSMWEFLEYMSA